MTWGIVASTVVGAYGAYSQKKAGDKAARAAGQGSDAEIAERRRQFDLTREDQKPWMQAGTDALGRMQSLNNGDFSQFYQSPDYKFSMDQGLKGLERGAAARGGLYSGGADADRMQFASGLATQNYGNFYNRLAGLSGTGQTTASGLGALGMGMANANANSISGATNARMSSYGNRADANSQFAAGLGGAFNQWNQRRLASSGGSSGFGGGW